jgi:hypothetical protein
MWSRFVGLLNGEQIVSSFYFQTTNLFTTYQAISQTHRDHSILIERVPSEIKKILACFFYILGLIDFQSIFLMHLLFI